VGVVETTTNKAKYHSRATHPRDFSKDDYIMTTTATQAQVLVDRSPSGKVRPWGVHKLMNGLLAHAYDDVDVKKAARLRECATVLGFDPVPSGGMRLKEANFCRVRLCPMCTWRRSLKTQAQVHAVMNAMKSGDKEYAFAYLTLTIRNVKGDKLKAALDELNRGFKRLMQTKEVAAAVKGFFKSMEVTHNVDHKSEWFDTYHPHIHVVLAVNTTYFKSRYYIRHDRWKELWQRSMRLDYEPDVDIRKVKGNTAEAVAEAAGYGTKAGSFIIPDDWDLTVGTVRLLDTVFDRRRFIGFGGVMRDYHRALKLDDPDEGDLIHIGDDEPGEAEGRRIYYAWHSGYRQYTQAD